MAKGRICFLPLAMLCLGVIECNATSIVVFVTKHAVILGADGKATVSDTRKRKASPSVVTHPKIFTINANVISAHAGYESLIVTGRGNSRLSKPVDYFSTPEIIEDLQRKASFVDGPSRISDVLKAKLTAKFANFDQLFLKTGSLLPTDLPAPHDVLTHFFIAGYDGQFARAYDIYVEIDWKLLNHKVSVDVLYPGQRRNLGFNWTGGAERGIIELLNPKSEILNRARLARPTEISALQQDLDLDITQTIALARYLLGIEIDRNPGSVGYPITIMTITPGRQIDTQTYKQ